MDLVANYWCSSSLFPKQVNQMQFLGRFFLVVALIVFLPFQALAWEARIIAVSDGDTITVEPATGGNRVKIRLHGIDAPERKQPYGEAARGFVFDSSLYKTVDVEELYQDRYKRTVAIIHFSNGKSLQSLLLEAGFAWVWPRYCKDCLEWETLQKTAQKERRGLWDSETPIPPWEWRKQH